MPPHQAPSRTPPTGAWVSGTTSSSPPQAWSQLPDRTAVYPPGALGYDDGVPQGGQAPPRSRAPIAGRAAGCSLRWAIGRPPTTARIGLPA